MIRLILLATLPACLSACGAPFVPPTVTIGGPAFISGKSPAAPLARNSEPEPVNSLPPGAQGLQSGPLATAPNYGSVTVGPTPR